MSFPRPRRRPDLRPLALLLFTLLAAAPLHARQAAPEPVATVEGITEYRLDNGLRVLLFPDASRPTTTVNITYFVGSRHEGYGETGMAHLLEHMLFKGTPGHPDIPQALTERGALPNASVWYDRTNFFATFPAAPENLEWYLGLEADRMLNSLLRAEDLASEMTVVRNEFEMRENAPGNVLRERVTSAAYDWHNYGNSPIGARSDIENMPIERLRDFYRRFYQPDNALLVVAGRFDEEHALRAVAAAFGPLARPDRTGPLRIYDTYTREPVQDGERAVTLRRIGDVQMAMAAWHIPGGAHPDFAVLEILAHVLGNTPSGRLHRALVEPGHATFASASAFQLREPGLFYAQAQLRRDGDLDVVRDGLLETVAQVIANPPTDEEVERARTALLRSIDLNLNNAERVGLELSEWAAMGDWRLLFIHRDRLRDVAAADVHRVARDYLRTSNRTLGLFIPTDAPDRAVIPEVPDIAPIVAAYRGDEARTAGEAFDASPLAIEARVERVRLPNGFNLVLLPKQTRGSTVNARLVLRLGSEQTLTGRAMAGSLAGGMLMRGTERRTREQLRDEIDRLGARLAVVGGATSASGTIETTRASLPDVLRLMGEVLRQPAFPADEFERLRQERIAGIEAQRSEPQAVAANAYGRHFSHAPPGHPHYAATFDEQLEMLRAASLDDVRAFYADFYGAAAGDLTVVGDFDAAEVRRIAEEIFGGWNAPVAFQRVGSPYRDVPPAEHTLRTPDRPNAFFMAGMNVQMRDDHEDFPALLMANYILGGGFLNSRLATRVRQQEGLSYAVASSFSAHPIDDGGSFTTLAIYAPENVARLESAIREEITRLVRDGVTPEELAAAQQGWIQFAQLQRAEDASLAAALGSMTYFGRTLQREADLEDAIRALTADQVNAALRRHIDPARLTVVKAGDFPDGD